MSPSNWVEAAFGIALLLVLAIATAWWLGAAVWIFTVELYRELRYGRFNVCYKCKKPYGAAVEKSADQMYGPSRITQGICSCGSRAIPHGNRRFAEW